MSRIVIPVGITPQNLHQYNLYDILGFGSELGDTADTEVIKKAYHKAVLLYHPDKAQYKTASGKEDRTVFLKIQEAFNVLTDEKKRRAYDSQLPFDESIPKEEKVIEKMKAKGDGKFLKLFDPVFKRNARFASKKPVPELGDINTPIIQVNKFYEYWINFESWRDFTGFGCEYNPDDAGSRDEKRWMQKENKKKEENAKKNEMKRLINLVTLAQKLDPRIAADKKNKKDAKDAIKQSKEAEAKQKADEEAAIKTWAEEKGVEATENKVELSKADKEKIKKAQSKVRNILRKLLRITGEQGHGSGEYGIISEKDLEILCEKGNIDDLNTLNNAMGGELASKDSSLFIMAGTAEVLKKLEEVKVEANKDEEDDKIAKEIRRREAAIKSTSNYKKVEKVWNDDEISYILSALKLYPPASNHTERWTKISSYVSVKVSDDAVYGSDEIIKIAYRATH